MSKYPSQMQDKFNLRFPDGMRDAIAERAKANGRSMNSEIVHILQQALDAGINSDEENERLASEAIERAYEREMSLLDEGQLDEWRKAIEEHTKLLNSITVKLKSTFKG
ncbi:Arc-like DNA binding domain [Serratia ficaria]|uniref:Arc family DNA-binding protein n=1 Tax=Serratia ficaria TaxID=61651 RepID=UPI00217C8456|nr:Arc family DNA-binding protein [Serratia ficaria]CAI2000950.1 Arc-like DNA binding domain [Serratia ficaria]CAI2081848.1 Arc-like DNA binding domain [Serratia ficaria]CAI2491420.1 Arc-like DNA binding domain [Serratia ficaria]